MGADTAIGDEHTPPLAEQPENPAHREHSALNRWIPDVYQELRRAAGAHVRKAHPDQTLSPTDLVHEAYLRLSHQASVPIESRTHFCALAAHIMRCVLVDRTRRRRAAKRPGSRIRICAEGIDGIPHPARDLDLEALDDALTSLAAVDPLKSRIVELRFFGGLSVDEVADALGLSPRTVARHWVVAKAWLYGEIDRGPRR